MKRTGAFLTSLLNPMPQLDRASGTGIRILLHIAEGITSCSTLDMNFPSMHI